MSKRFGPYLIKGIIATTAQATLYLAEYLPTGELGILKVYHPKLTADPAAREQLLNHLKKLRDLPRHVGILPILEVGEASFAHEPDIIYVYVTTPYCPQGDLRHYLNEQQQQQKPLPLPLILRWVAELADALAHAHAHGLRHGDVKTENVLLCPTRDPDYPHQMKLTDFALMRGTGVQPIGSYPYMSPEQVRKESLDGRSDIYALGVLLYLLLAGHFPFDIKKPADVAQHLYAPFEPPRTAPPNVQAIVARAMSRDVNGRYPTASAMATDLRQIIATLHPATPPVPPPAAELPLVPTELRGLDKIAHINVGERLEKHLTWENPSEYRLIVSHQYEGDRLYYLRQGYVRLGRDPKQNDIVLPDVRVSRQHAILERIPRRQWQILSLKGANKLFLEGKDRSDQTEPIAWDKEETLRIGPYFLRWQDVALVNGPVDEEPDDLAVAPPPGDVALTVTVEPEGEIIFVQADQTVPLIITLHNRSETTNHYQLEFVGPEQVPLRWQNPAQPLQLNANETGTQEIRLSTFPNSAATAGRYPCHLRIYQVNTRTLLQEYPLVIEIPPFDQLAVDMHPSRIRHGDATQIRLENRGNTPQTYRLLARDQADELLFFPFPDRQVVVPNGGTVVERLEVKAKKRPWVRAASAPFTVEIKSPRQDQAAAPLQGELQIPQRIPTWLPIVLLGVIALAIFGYVRLQDVVAQEQQKVTEAQENLVALRATAAALEGASDEEKAALEEQIRQGELDLAEAQNNLENINNLSSVVGDVAPIFTSAPLVIATEDEVYSYEIQVTDQNENDVITISASKKPEWLTLSEAGKGKALLRGTPLNEHVGQYDVVLVAKDSTGLTAEQAYTLTVENQNDPPQFETKASDITDAEEDSPYSFTVVATDPDEGDSLKISASGKPDWVNFSDNGDGTAVLSGTPTNDDVGSSQFTLLVQDKAGENGDPLAVKLTVKNVNDPPVVQGFSKDGDEDKTLSFTPGDFKNNFSDPDPQGKLDSVKFVTVPPPATGKLMIGTASVSTGQVVKAADLSQIKFEPVAQWNGTTTFSWNASDGELFALADDLVTINIKPDNDPPNFVPGALTITVDEDSGTYNQAWATQITPGAPDETEALEFVVDPGNKDLFSNAPTVNPETGNLVFTLAANESGKATLKIVLQEKETPSSKSKVEEVTITVKSINDQPVLECKTLPMTSIEEDLMENNGQEISAILGKDCITDSDDGEKGIAIVGVEHQNGEWQYCLENCMPTSSWIKIDDGNTAVLLHDSAYLRFVPNANYFGIETGKVEIRAWDRSDGKANGTDEASIPSELDAQSAYSADDGKITIEVTPVNDPPVIDLNGQDPGRDREREYRENSSIDIVDSPDPNKQATITDVEGNNISSATVIITNPQDGDILIPQENDFPEPIILDSTCSSPTKVCLITKSGFVATPEDYAQAIRKISYQTNSANPASTPARIVEFTVTDIPADVSQRAETSDIATATITVVPVNDPPSFVSPLPALLLKEINTSQKDNNGNSVAEIMCPGNNCVIEDPDGPGTAIAITNASHIGETNSEGWWQYCIVDPNTDGCNSAGWQNFSFSLQGGTAGAIHLGLDDRIRFLPTDAVPANSPNFTFYAWDMSDLVPPNDTPDTIRKKVCLGSATDCYSINSAQVAITVTAPVVQVNPSVVNSRYCLKT